ncbi:MAG: hypothetical protein R3B09_11590 [Nannocystaceae bacterium]
MTLGLALLGGPGTAAAAAAAPGETSSTPETSDGDPPSGSSDDGSSGDAEAEPASDEPAGDLPKEAGPSPLADPPTIPDPEVAVDPTPPAPPTVLPPRHRIAYTNATFVRYNPLGLENRLKIVYQRRLWGRTGKLFDGAYVGVGPKLDISPSNFRAGGVFELVPLAILQLRAAYYLLGYFGSQKYKAHPFTSPTDEYGPDELKIRADQDLAINVFGGQLEANALFQVKFGPIALRDEVTYFHNTFTLPAPADVFYDLRTDLLVPAKGGYLGNDADLLYVNDKLRLAVGARGTYYHVFYPASVFEDGDVEVKGQNDHARVGPLVTYRFKDRPERRFVRPTLFFAAQWWVKHRYRASQQIHQGIPLLVLGFSFSGDLWARE